MIKLKVYKTQPQVDREELLNGYGVSFRGDENVLEIDRCRGCSTL